TMTVNYSGDGKFRTSSASTTVSIVSAAYVLNPTAKGALSMSGSANLQVGGLLMVDSSSSTALTGSGNAILTAGSIQIVGKFSWTASGALTPTRAAGAAPGADPVAKLAAPTGGACMGTVSLSGGSLTISPGIYTGITLSSSASLILKPGVYVLAGGGLNVSGSASSSVASGFDPVTGHGIMIYNAGSNFPVSGGSFGAINVSGTGSINLKAPDQGPYAGITIFQARDNAKTLSYSGQGNILLQTGLTYAAAAQLNTSGQEKIQYGLIVNTISASGTQSSSVATTGSGSFTVVVATV